MTLFGSWEIKSSEMSIFRAILLNLPVLFISSGAVFGQNDSAIFKYDLDCKAELFFQGNKEWEIPIHTYTVLDSSVRYPAWLTSIFSETSWANEQVKARWSKMTGMFLIVPGMLIFCHH